MAKEPDQTRWVGIRPTDPSEEIPVTESAPLTSIEVEPTAGSANFPVTESAPLSSIEVEPTAGSANFPVTESAPLSSIKVEPLAVGTEFKTLTEKRSPAIADLQAPETMVRVSLTTVAVAGANTVTVYTVPAGKLFKMQINTAMANNNAPTSVTMRFDLGAVNYVFDNTVYGAAWSLDLCTVELLLNEGEIIKHIWAGCGLGNTLYDSMLGYTIDKY